MSSFWCVIVCFGLSVVGFTACKEKVAPKPMTIDQTRTLLWETELGAVEYPTESLDSRAARIRQLVAPYGLTVSISDTMKGTEEVNWIKLPNPSVAMLLKFTCGNRKIKCRPVPSGIEFFYNEYPNVQGGESVASDDAIDPFASPAERCSASDPADEVVDDPDDPFKPIQKTNKP